MTGLNVRIHIENFFKDLAHSLRRVEPYDALKQGTIPCLDAPSFLGVFRLLCRCELRTASYGPTPAAVRDRRFSPLDNTVTVATRSIEPGIGLEIPGVAVHLPDGRNEGHRAERARHTGRRLGYRIDRREGLCRT